MEDGIKTTTHSFLLTVFINETPLVLLLLYFEPQAVESTTRLFSYGKCMNLKDTIADIITET